MRITYFQKSRAVLFPLTEIKNEFLSNTYLFSDEIEESILDGILLCNFSSDIQSDKVVSVYPLENDTYLYSIDISDYQEDINKFLAGEYSKLSETAKEKVLQFYNVYYKSNGKLIKRTKDQLIAGNQSIEMYSLLFPEECKKEIAKELVDINKLYDNYQEAYKVVKSMKELYPIYNLDKETLKLKIC